MTINPNSKQSAIGHPDFACKCWEQSNDRFCFDCEHFNQYSRRALEDNSMGWKDAEERMDLIKQMKVQGLDTIYVCSKKHYIKHAYSGSCYDYIAKLRVSTIQGDDIHTMDVAAKFIGVSDKIYYCFQCNRKLKMNEIFIYCFGGSKRIYCALCFVKEIEAISIGSLTPKCEYKCSNEKQYVNDVSNYQIEVHHSKHCSVKNQSYVSSWNLTYKQVDRIKQILDLNENINFFKIIAKCDARKGVRHDK